MRLLIGLILMLGGGGVALYGIGGALSELVGLYDTALTDPLGAPEGQEEAASQGMIRHVIIGGVGIPPFLIGSTIVYTTIRINRQKRRRVGRSAPGAGGW